MPWGLEELLDLSDIGEGRKIVGVLVAAGFEGQQIALEHAPEETDDGAVILRMSQFCSGLPPSLVQPNFS
jgi:hypothetical protein